MSLSFIAVRVPLTEKQPQTFSSAYSSQTIEIYQNQVSNIGLGNLQARLEFSIGVTFEKSALGRIGIEGLGRRALAWGIANQNFYFKNSDKLNSRQYPWAMILIKEKDDVWRILASHWAVIEKDVRKVIPFSPLNRKCEYQLRMRANRRLKLNPPFTQLSESLRTFGKFFPTAIKRSYLLPVIQ